MSNEVVKKALKYKTKEEKRQIEVKLYKRKIEILNEVSL